MAAESPYLIKICGNRYFADSMRVARYRPDFMGWIFSPKSPRRIFPEQARPQLRAIRAAYPRIRHVAVFAANTVPEMARVVAALPEIDLVQIVGGSGLVESSRRYVAGSSGRPAAGIVPALRIGAPLENDELLRYGRAEFFVLDSYVSGVPGGTGHRLHSEYVRSVRRPFLLAGGLRPENVAEALAATPAIGADVSSGLEDAGSPGRKNEEKLANFFAAVREMSK